MSMKIRFSSSSFFLSCWNRVSHSAFHAENLSEMSRDICDTLLYLLVDGLADAFEIMVHFTVGTPKNFQSISNQQFCSLRVMSLPFFCVMLSAVQFDHKFSGTAIKILNSRINAVLSADLDRIPRRKSCRKWRSCRVMFFRRSRLRSFNAGLYPVNLFSSIIFCTSLYETQPPALRIPRTSSACYRGQIPFQGRLWDCQ